MRPKSSIPPAYKRDRGDHPSTFHMGFYLGIYPSSWSVLGPVYKYLDILENGEFSPFSKKIRAAHTKRIGITFSLSLRSAAVLVGCVNKPRWAKAVKLRRDRASPLVRARFYCLAAQWCGRQNRHATQKSFRLACVASVSARVRRERRDESKNDGGRGGERRKLFFPPPPPSTFFFAPALTFAQWLDWKRLLRRLVFARSHAHENTKTVEIRYHPLQGMGCIIYEIIIFVLSHKNNQPAFSKNSAPRTVFENLSFCCPKTPFTCGRRA